jgi:hypothetical protein
VTAVRAVKAKTNGQVGPGSSEPFTYTTQAGNTFTIASLAKPFETLGELMDLHGADPLTIAMYIIKRDCTTPDSMAAAKAMSIEEFATFSQQWADHSGISMGE